MEKVKKLKTKKYIRIKPDVFKGWISEIMKEERFRYASARVVAEEIQKRYGGLVSSHMGKLSYASEHTDFYHVRRTRSEKHV